MKIFDCFTFYNELDLLELRLELLYEHVDHFVIVEATKTFQNSDKPLYYQKNQKRFKKYSNKIIHVVVDNLPGGDPWMNERFQRDAIMSGLTAADGDDIAIIGDVDEILRPNSIQEMRNSTSEVFGFRMPYFNFKLNYMLIGNSESYNVWTTATKVKLITSPEEFRRTRSKLNKLNYGFNDGKIKLLEHSGWHFTYLGDDDFIRTKIKSFSHAELNKLDVLEKINVEESISKGVGFNPYDTRKFIPVVMDNYFPEEFNKYKNFIIGGATSSAFNYMLPNTNNLDLITLSNALPTDKERAHKYVSNFYAQQFAKYQTRKLNLLEIGIWNGGSVAMWHDYFPEATVYATDITNSRFTIDVTKLPRARISICDAYTESFRDQLPEFDIIIDDGPHSEESQLRCIELYANKLTQDGIMVIEDVVDERSIEKFIRAVPEGFTYEVHDIRPFSKLPESLLFIVKRK